MLRDQRELYDDLFTDLCDRDAAWGPLLFLRPRRHERLDPGRTLALAVVTGLLFGLLGNALLLLVARSLGQPAPSPYAFPCALTASYFLICNLTIAPAWNRRARRLSGGS